MTTPDWIDQADVTWIRALARTLVKDEGRADDAAQEALLVWMKRLPGRSASRGWLRRVLENRLRQGAREEARRARRERERPAPGVGEGEADAVQRARLQRQVMDRVLALDEPYRETVLLRYFEGLGPSKIAARQGVPVDTVKTRLKRGLGRLRNSLDGEFGGDRRAWVMAFGTHLIPRVAPAAGALAAAAGASIMTNKTLLVPAALMAIATLYVYMRPGEDGAQRAAAAPARTEANLGAPAADAPAPSLTAASVGRSEAAVPGSATADPAPQGAPPALVAVDARVIDLRGDAVAGVPVTCVDPDEGSDAAPPFELGTSDSAGRVQVEMERGPATLVVETDRWTTVHAGAVQSIGSRAEATVLVAAPRLIEGRVIDHLGEPVPDAEVRYSTRVNPWSSLEVTVDSANAPRIRAHTDDAGAFRFERAPELTECFLEVIVNGDERSQVSIADWGNVWREVRLVDPAEREGWLRGTVVDRGGEPVEGALVTLGYTCVRTGAGGAFDLDLALPSKGDGLVAAAEGHLPGRVEPREDGTWPDPLVVVLGDAPLAMTGTVVDIDGRPLAGMNVRLLGTAGFGMLQDEDNASSLTLLSVESYLGGAHGTKATTEGSGAFEFRGLRPTDYRILVSADGELDGLVFGPVAAGTRDLVIAMPAAPEEVLVSGTVTDRSGAPIANASVSLFATLPDPGAPGSPAELKGPWARSAEDGTFSFEPLAVAKGASARLRVFAGAGYAFHVEEVDLSGGGEVEVRVEVSALAPFFVESGETGARSFELRDPDGAPTGLFQAQGQGMFSMQSGFFADGRSPVFSAAEGEYELVLLDGSGAVVGRRTIELEPGEPRRVSF